ncbi:MAG: hypothetical protein A2086_00575 [Spirochaetes bacterium GWD1_27_9]|nr:MAG: hypothetical protein A2Z98_05085 [Spirochaetes bacterium GWB1_27_13]OHD25033.1 MAG: hypothetical protein A2Y34_03140 [Spirochaetes bacterium GWC1_27_15]OHD32504.1 MAG: hypothetical protein A2086_00575 [Spirochaetes bacterium GWD1_27_9]
MKDIIGFCGINCSKCPAFVATQKNDDAEREKVSEMWSKQFNVSIKKEDINCNGCIVDSPNLFSHCKVCEIRKCGKSKGIENCGYCDSFACEKLTAFMDMVPDAKNNLMSFRQNLK